MCVYIILYICNEIEPFRTRIYPNRKKRPRKVEIYSDRPTHRLRPCTIQSLFHGLRLMASVCIAGLCRAAYDLHMILRIRAFYSYSLRNLSTMDVHRQISVARALLCPHPACYDFHESAFHAISVLYRMYFGRSQTHIRWIESIHQCVHFSPSIDICNIKIQSYHIFSDLRVCRFLPYHRLTTSFPINPT